MQLINGYAWAERPENEIPMYGGDRAPLVEREPPKNAKEKADFQEWSRGTSQLGWEYFYKGDADTAIKRFNQAWLFDPDNPQVWWGFGVIMGDRGMKECKDNFLLKAIEYLQKASSLDEKNYQIMIDLAITYTRLGSLKLKSDQMSANEAFTNALHWFAKAEGICDKDPLLWFNKAHSQCVMGLIDKAIVSYIKGTELTPYNAEGYNDFAWLLATCPDDKYRNGKKAVELAQKAMELMPNVTAIYDTLAAAYAEEGQFKKAVDFQQKAIDLQKKDFSEDNFKECLARLNSYKQKKPWRDPKLIVRPCVPSTNSLQGAE